MTDADVESLMRVNLGGAIHLTRGFAPLMKDVPSAQIIHIIGFGDGRLAFPFYAVDVATRALLAHRRTEFTMSRYF